jgi:hypothetical protein
MCCFFATKRLGSQSGDMSADAAAANPGAVSILLKQPRKLRSWIIGAHKGFAYEEGINPMIAHQRDIGGYEYAAFGNHNAFGRNAVQQLQRGAQASFERMQVAIIGANQRGI